MKNFFYPALDRLNRVAAPINERFNAWSAREKTLAVFFGLIFLFGLDYWIWAAPAMRSVSRNYSEKSGLESEAAQLRDYKANGQKIARQYESIASEFAEKKQALVGSDQVPVLLEKLSEQARSTGIKILSLKPVGDASSPRGKYYSSVPIQLSAQAGTHELGRFLDEIESGKILMKVTNVEIAADPADERQHKIELGLEAYRDSASREASRG